MTIAELAKAHTGNCCTLYRRPEFVWRGGHIYRRDRPDPAATDDILYQSPPLCTIPGLTLRPFTPEEIAALDRDDEAGC